MNKSFVREPDQTVDYCPRCGSAGRPVGQPTLEAQLPESLRTQIATTANFCPSPRCEVAYFDSFERFIPTTALGKPIYPKDPDAPICGCFGVTCDEIEKDLAEGVVTRTRALVERAKSPEANCPLLAANGRSCVAEVQRYYMQRRNAT